MRVPASLLIPCLALLVVPAPLPAQTVAIVGGRTEVRVAGDLVITDVYAALINPAGLEFEALINPAGLEFEALINPAGLEFEALINPAGLEFDALINPAGLEFDVVIPVEVPLGAQLIGADVSWDGGGGFSALLETASAESVFGLVRDSGGDGALLTLTDDGRLALRVSAVPEGVEVAVRLRFAQRIGDAPLARATFPRLALGEAVGDFSVVADASAGELMEGAPRWARDAWSLSTTAPGALPRGHSLVLIGR